MPLKVATINVNGIRAAFKNGMAGWLSENTDIDVFALQEVRAETKDLVDLFEANPPVPDSKGQVGKWFFAHDAASAKGRAGVAIVSKTEPIAVRTTLGPDSFDSAGRWLEADFKVGSKVVTVISTYVHSGEVDTPKQVEKYKFLKAMQERMAELVAAGGYAVVVGDLNVGHTELDIKNWKGNLKNAGFLPEERAYFDTFMNAQGWVDIGRATHPGEPGPYTWWSYRGKAFDTDAGWRIDYHLATPKLAAKASNYKVHRAPSYDTRWTDHSPVVVDYGV